MNMHESLVFLVLGAAIGFAGGLFAIGGALIAIPVLAVGFSFAQHDAQGTAMVMALASALVTMTIYARSGLLSIREALIMTVCNDNAHVREPRLGLDLWNVAYRRIVRWRRVLVELQG